MLRCKAKSRLVQAPAPAAVRRCTAGCRDSAAPLLPRSPSRLTAQERRRVFTMEQAAVRAGRVLAAGERWAAGRAQSQGKV